MGHPRRSYKFLVSAARMLIEQQRRLRPKMPCTRTRPGRRRSWLPAVWEATPAAAEQAERRELAGIGHRTRPTQERRIVRWLRAPTPELLRAKEKAREATRHLQGRPLQNCGTKIVRRRQGLTRSGHVSYLPGVSARRAIGANSIILRHATNNKSANREFLGTTVATPTPWSMVREDTPATRLAGEASPVRRTKGGTRRKKQRTRCQWS